MHTPGHTPARCGGPWARLGAWAPSLVCGGFARRSFLHTEENDLHATDAQPAGGRSATAAAPDANDSTRGRHYIMAASPSRGRADSWSAALLLLPVLLHASDPGVPPPDCTKLQQIVVSEDPDPCQRFGSDAVCCRSHRVKLQPCRYSHAESSCRRTSIETHGAASTCRWPDGSFRLEASASGRQWLVLRASVTEASASGRQCAPRHVRVAHQPIGKPSARRSRKKPPPAGQSHHGQTHLETWRPADQAGGTPEAPWQFSACQGMANATRLLQERKAHAVENCIVPNQTSPAYKLLGMLPPGADALIPKVSGTRCYNRYLPYCGMYCDLRYCRSAAMTAKPCKPKDARRLLKLRCATGRRFPPSELAHMLRWRPTFVSRAGNGDLKLIESAAKLIARGYSIGDPAFWRTNLSLWVGLVDPRMQQLYSAGFATRQEDMPAAIRRFLEEYTHALKEADHEMLWDDQCHVRQPALTHSPPGLHWPC